MTRTKQPFRDFDLPVKHLGEADHFIPPKARDADEIARRRAMRRGGLLAEYQLKGIGIAAKVLDFAATQGEQDEFLVNTLAAAEFNTAWYNHSASARDVMRRRLKLPRHDKNPAAIETTRMLQSGRDHLLATTYAAKLLIRYPGMPNFTKEVGTRLGDASLHLASIAVQPELAAAGNDTFLIQEITRHAAMLMVESSRQMHEDVHANPSLAQLADPDSPLSHYWRVNGSDIAVQALEFATTAEPQPPVEA
ncbi:MAG: hypothetical protein JWO47_588 [Candidatus Saccharibacteria bacterium]|nr:hypothetical protein [Candidatus Saccharibacteria bacterium]